MLAYRAEHAVGLHHFFGFGEGHLFPDAEDLGRAAVDQALAPALAEQDRNRSAS